MGSSPRGRKSGVGQWLAGASLLLWLGVPAAGQQVFSLQQANERNPAAGFAPLHAGKTLTVQGVVNSRASQFAAFKILAIEDASHGAILQTPPSDPLLDRYSPGDEVSVTGQVVLQDGVPMIRVNRMAGLGRKTPPGPTTVSTRELSGFRHFGRLVRTEAEITGFGDTSNGSFVRLDLASQVTAFLPRSNSHPPLIAGLEVGNSVWVTGVAFQFCPSPPHDRFFQVLVSEPSALTPARENMTLRPSAVAAALGGVLLAVFLLWSRDRRMRSQRERLRKTYQLGEEVLSSSSAAMILQRLDQTLQQILHISKVRLYVYNRTAKALDEVPGENEPTVSISLSAPPGGPRAGAVACFHYRTLLVIPDIDRSPFPIGTAQGPAPKSLLFVPMMAQGEVVGVLELDQDNKVRDFTADEQELAQHLGNQVAVAVRLLDQRTVQEQLFRTEKMAAVGRLISGVVNELQAPLSSISELAGRALERARAGPAERDVLTLAAEARKASKMVERLVSFAAAEQADARQVSIGDLLHNLIEFREGDWKASGIKVLDLTTRDAMTVLGSHGQIEQVFLHLMVHAEQALTEAPQKVITIRSSVLAKRLLVEIAFTAPADWRTPEETAAVLGVTRSVIGAHGGEVRLVEKNNSEPRFEVELPVLSRERMAGPVQTASASRLDPARKLTALVIDSDETTSRQLTALLASRACRAVPVSNTDTGLELAHRMKFDFAFCSVHAPGLNWVELSERMHARVGAFVLVSDGYDAELSADFEGESRFVLPRPIQELDLDRVLQGAEPAAASQPIVMPSMKHGAA
jgi:GAF domain-containing protein